MVPIDPLTGSWKITLLLDTCFCGRLVSASRIAITGCVVCYGLFASASESEMSAFAID